MTAFAFHPGELEVQHRAGESDMAARVAHGVHEELPEPVVRFLAAQPFVAIASTDAEGRPHASLLVGPPGFLRAADPRTLVIRALPRAGDPLAEALARADEEPGPRAEAIGAPPGPTGPAPVPVGLLAIEPATRRRVRINGTARRDGDRIVVATTEVFSNCPKYISARVPVAVDRAAPGERLDAAALGDDDVRLIARSDTFFVASASATGADVSHRGGTPGVVRVSGPTALSFPDYTGNGMFMTLGNLTLDPRISLLVVDWDTGDLLRIDGAATIDWSAERAAAVAGARRMVDVEVSGVARYPGASPLRWRLEERSRFNP